MINYKKRLEECEIDLKELFYRIVLKWRQMLLAFLIVGALFGVVSGVKSYQDVKNAETVLAEQKKQGGPKEGEELVVVPELQVINLKDTIVVGIGGIIAVASIVATKFMFSKYLRDKHDLKDIFDIYPIAVLTSYKRLCKRKSKVDKVINNVFWKNEPRINEKDLISLAVTDCKMLLTQKRYKSICFISSLSDDFRNVNEIVYKLRPEVDTCMLKKTILSSAEALQAIQKYDCVVLVERIDDSLYEDIISEVEYCNKHKVAILGYIIEE